MRNKRYVQFSKRMTVLSVLAAVLAAAGTELLLWQMAYPAGIVEVCKAMLLFAGLVFVAYCGNSAVEKWALSRYGSISENKDENG